MREVLQSKRKQEAECLVNCALVGDERANCLLEEFIANTVLPDSTACISNTLLWRSQRD